MISALGSIDPEADTDADADIFAAEAILLTLIALEVRVFLNMVLGLCSDARMLYALCSMLCGDLYTV
jgi:hypothetical protein